MPEFTYPKVHRHGPYSKMRTHRCMPYSRHHAVIDNDHRSDSRACPFNCLGVPRRVARRHLHNLPWWATSASGCGCARLCQNIKANGPVHRGMVDWPTALCERPRSAFRILRKSHTYNEEGLSSVDWSTYLIPFLIMLPLSHRLTLKSNPWD